MLITSTNESPRRKGFYLKVTWIFGENNNYETIAYKIPPLKLTKVALFCYIMDKQYPNGMSGNDKYTMEEISPICTEVFQQIIKQIPEGQTSWCNWKITDYQTDRTIDLQFNLSQEDLQTISNAKVLT
jgi:hypothetical protein